MTEQQKGEITPANDLAQNAERWAGLQSLTLRFLTLYRRWHDAGKPNGGLLEHQVDQAWEKLEAWRLESIKQSLRELGENP